MQKIIYAFSYHSHKSTIPNLLKDTKYTSKGYLKTSTRLRKPQLPIDLPNRHLYFDYEQAQRISNSAFWKQKYEFTELSDILAMLNNEKYIRLEDLKLMKALKLISIHHPAEITNNWDSFDRAFNIILKNVRYLDIYNFKSYVQMADKHYPNQEQVWKTLYQNMIPFIVSYEQQQNPLLSAICKKDDQDCFIKSYHLIMKRAKSMKFNLTHLIMQLDYMMRNHLRFPIVNILRQHKHSKQQHNKWANIQDPNQLAIFLSYYAFALQQRTDYYNPYDEKVKKDMIRDQLFEGQKLLMGKSLQQSIQTLLVECVNEENRYKELFEKFK